MANKQSLTKATLTTNISTMAKDLDVTSSYPSVTSFANVAADTTKRYITGIAGFTPTEFRPYLINTLTGPATSADFCVKMLNFPTIFELEKLIP